MKCSCEKVVPKSCHATSGLAQPSAYEDYGPACMSLGRAVFIKDKEQGLLLLQKACELGYFGNYACYQLAEALSKAGKREASITAYLSL